MSNKSVGFRLEFQGAQSTVDQLVDVEIAMGKITDRLKQLKKEGGLEKNVEEVRKLKLEQRALQEQGKDLRKEQQQMINEFKKSKFPKDSLIGMREEYNKLTREIEKMDAAQRKTSGFKKMIKEANELNASISKVEQSIGNHRRNVGNYGGAFKEGLKGVGQTLSGGLLMGGAIGAGAMVSGAALQQWKKAINTVNEFEQAIADLDAIADVSADELERLKQSAIDLSGAFSAKQVAELQLELSKLGFTTEEILELTESVINLSIALGGPANETAALLGATLNGFGEEANQAAKYAEVLAAAANKSALDFADFEIALPKVAAAARAMGLTVEQVTAQLGVLRDNGIRAESAGVGLRNIFLMSAKAGVPFQQQLDKIKNSTDQVATATKLFKSENAVAAIVLANSTAQLKELEAAVTGTSGEIEKLSQKKLDTVIGQTTLFRNEWDKLVLSIQDGDGAISDFVKNAIKGVSNVFSTLTAFNDGDIGFFTAIDAFVRGDTLGAKLEAMKNKAIKENKLAAKEIQKTWQMENIFGALPEVSQKPIEITDMFPNGTDDDLGGGGKKKDIGAKGSITYLTSKLKDFQDQLSRIDPASEGFKTAAKKVDEYTVAVEKAKKANDDLLNALEAKREREKDPLLTNGAMPEIDNINLIPTSITSLTAISPVQSDIDARNKGVIDAKKKFNKEWKDLSVQHNKDNDETNAEAKAKDDKRAAEIIQNQEDLIKALKDAAFDLAIGVSDALFNAEMEQVNRQKEAKLAALDEEYSRKQELAEGDAELQKRIAKEQAAERKKIEKEAFEQNKKLAILQAFINGALSIGQAFATLPPPAAIAMLPYLAAQTLVQVTTIAAQKFAKGGKVKRIQPGLVTDAPNVPPTPEGDSVLGLLAPGETVLTRKNVDDLGGPATMARIGVPGYTGSGKPISYFYPGHRIPQYNTGGFVGNYDFRNAPDALISTNGLPANASATFSNDQIMMMANIIAQSVANQLAPLVGLFYQATKEGTFQGLNEDKRLKEREASSNQNSNF